MEDLNSFSDGQLVQKIRSGDSGLYRQLVDKYQPGLMRYVNYLIHSESKSADVVQETFIKAFINLNSFNTGKKFSSWIYRIAHNEAINEVKKYRREFPIDPKLDISSSEDLEEDLTKKEISARAKKCLNMMPLSYSEPLSLYYLEDKTYEEISDILRLPIGTVGTRINRAKKLMKKICQKTT